MILPWKDPENQRFFSVKCSEYWPDWKWLICTYLMTFLRIFGLVFSYTTIDYRKQVIPYLDIYYFVSILWYCASMFPLLTFLDESFLHKWLLESAKCPHRNLKFHDSINLKLGIALDGQETTWNKYFKNGKSKICGRQPLKIWRGMVCLNQYPFKFFKGCLLQILLSPFFNPCQVI